MTAKTFSMALGEISTKYIDDAVSYKPKRTSIWLKYCAAAAACLCLAAALVYAFLPTSSREPTEDGGDISHIVLDGKTYIVSPYLAVSDELPDGFAYGGETSEGNMVGYGYYVNPDIKEWVYLYTQVTTDGTVDETGTLVPTEPHNAYVRYVESSIRGRDFISYNGSLYISMWSAESYGENPDADAELCDQVRNELGIRIEGDPPAGFAYVGTTEFSGYDTVPEGGLSSNTGEYEVYAGGEGENIILASTTWHTSSDGNGETLHRGFNVYVPYVGK